MLRASRFSHILVDGVMVAHAISIWHAAQALQVACRIAAVYVQERTGRKTTALHWRHFGTDAALAAARGRCCSVPAKRQL